MAATLKILGDYPSPFVHKSLLVLREKGVEYEWVRDSPLKPGNSISRLNPLGKIPILLPVGGEPIYDSSVIVEFVDNLKPQPMLIPRSGHDRVGVRQWEALADGLCDTGYAYMAETRRPSTERSESWMKTWFSRIENALATLSAKLGEKRWCHGEDLTLADLCVGAALTYVDIRFKRIDWRLAHPNLDALASRLFQRPSFSGMNWRAEPEA